jgi:uncharacterized membrane protein
LHFPAKGGIIDEPKGFYITKEVFLMNNNRDKLRVLTLAALFTALTTVATLLIQIPTPTKGYVNLGDSIVNIAAWVLGPAYGAAAAGVGSAIADIVSGYVVYAPVTLVVKAAMAVASALVIRAAGKRSGSLLPRIAAAASAEVIMVVGYALFEAVLYHSASAALLGVPANAVQGALGAAVSVAVYELVIKRVPRFDKK